MAERERDHGIGGTTPAACLVRHGFWNGSSVRLPWNAPNNVKENVTTRMSKITVSAVENGNAAVELYDQATEFNTLHTTKAGKEKRRNVVRKFFTHSSLRPPIFLKNDADV